MRRNVLLGPTPDPGVRASSMGLGGQSSAVGRLEARVLSSPPKAAELLDLVDRVIAFTRAGIDGCTAPPKKR
jgi:hypothetical protein